jgi:ATP-dependent helicase/nuclease subunit B
MIKIVYSLSGEKRLSYLTNRLNSIDNGVLIVPEQFLFESERSMYRLLGARKIAVTEITGFSKLAADVIKKHGNPKLYADDIVKGVTMFKTLKRLKPGIGCTYDNVSRMLNFAADLKAAAITPDCLKAKADEIAQPKLFEIAQIYSAYCDTLDVEFADRLDDCRIAADLVTRWDCFDGKKVFLYEFDGFSASQLALIKAIAESAETVEILLRTDSPSGEFHAMNLLIKKFEPCEFTDLRGRSNSPVVELRTADNVHDECEFVASTIRRLITREGFFCNDIAVLSCDSSNSGRLKEVLTKYDIPCYADLPEPIISKPMTRFIIAALEATGLNTPQLLSYIRSGFVRVRADLENYEAARNMVPVKFCGKEKRYEYNKSGSRLTRRLSKRSMDLLERGAFRFALTRREWGRPFPQANRHLREIEPLRSQVVQPLINLREACTNKTGDVITEVLCEFLLETMQLQRTVLGLITAFDGHASWADEFRQLWDLVIDVFESLHVSLKDEPISLNDYTDLLKGVFSSVNIAKPPAVLDAVVIGDLTRSRMSDVKAAFVTGANSGSFPKSAAAGDGGVFSGTEIEAFADCGLEISARLEQRYHFERLMVNKAMTLPSKRLFISAPLCNAAWEELTPAGIFCDYHVQHFSKKQTTTTGERFEINHELTPQTAQKLFKFNIFSPTAIETMMSCRFRYFCKYGLLIDIPVAENDEEPAAAQRGNIIHYCLDRALRESVADSHLEGFVESCIRDYRAINLPYGYAQTNRQSYILMSFKTGIVRMIRHIRREFEDSGFKPAYFEKKIDFLFGDVRIGGKIDRVDRKADSGQADYIRVIDYKSGNKVMDFPSVFYGLDMQMLLYLFAQSQQEAKPAAALYLPSDGARVKGALIPGADETEIHKNWLWAHIPSGITVGAPHESSKVRNLSPACYDKLKDYCKRLIDVRIKQIKRGGIESIAVAMSCDYCEFAGACNVKRIKPVNKELIERVITDDTDP